MKNLIQTIAMIFLTISEAIAITPLRQAIINQQTNESARYLYLGYSAVQKQEVWIDKLNQVLSLTIWTPEQRAFLLSVKNNIDLQLFEEGSIQQKRFDSNYSAFEINGINLFGKVVFAKVFISLSDYNSDGIPYSGGGGYGNDLPSCGCCIDCTFTCDWVFGSSTCTKSNCSGALRGCGGLWNQKCNGDCIISGY